MSMFSFKSTSPAPFSNLSGSTSGIQQTSNPSVPQLFTFGATSSPSSPFGTSTPFGGFSAFNAATNTSSDRTQNVSLISSPLPSFGMKSEGIGANKPFLWSTNANVSDTSIFGTTRAPAFGVTNNSWFGISSTPRLGTYSFGQPDVSAGGSTQFLESSGFGKSAFGINQKGSKIVPYAATRGDDSTMPRERIISIAAMDTYKNKSHDELRFEDYQLGDKGQGRGSSGVSGTLGFGVTSSISSPFKTPVSNQSMAGQPSPLSNPFVLQNTGTFPPSNQMSTTSASNPFFRSSQPTISSMFSPKTSSLSSTGTGSRVASYRATTFHEELVSLKLVSISAMPNYSDKSHEELRLEDYHSANKDGRGASENFASGIGVATSISTMKPLEPSSSSTASNVSFSLWTNPKPYAPLNPASCSSITSTFSPFWNQPAFSTSSTPSISLPAISPLPCLPTHNLTTVAASDSTSCMNFQNNSESWQFQPTSLNLFNVSSTPSIGLQNSCSTSSMLSTGNQLRSSQNTPEITPNAQATYSTVISSQPSTGTSFSSIGQGVGHLSFNVQQSNSPSITALKPSVVFPFETKQAIQVSVQPVSATSIQYGISSLPVSDKSAPVSRRSSLIIRHSSLIRHRLPPQKYNPTSDKPKVPFFMDKEDASGIVRKEAVIIRRENPRDWVRSTTKEFPLTAECASVDSPHDGDKVGARCDNPNLAAEQMHHDNSGQLKHSVQASLGGNDEAGIVSKHDKDVHAIMPKLQRADYYMVPPIQDLMSKEKEEPDFCCHVKDLVVGRHGYGSIKFLGETDVRKLDLDSAVQFNCREVIIYMDESKKPPIGQGLNKPAEITLLNVRCISKSTGKECKDGPTVNKYRDMLIKKTVEQDAEFVSYDPSKGEWAFKVSHF